MIVPVAVDTVVLLMMGVCAARNMSSELSRGIKFTAYSCICWLFQLKKLGRLIWSGEGKISRVRRMKAYWGSRGIAPLLRSLGSRWICLGSNLGAHTPYPSCGSSFISSKLKVGYGRFIHIYTCDFGTFVTHCFYVLYIWAFRWVLDINIFLAMEGFHKKLRYLSGK